LQPADQNIVRQLLAEGKITEEQAKLSQFIPMADDITVEADSGGHTDNRPLVSILPAIIQLRDSIQEKYHFAQPTRIGAAGGIATPASALAAFMMGAAYVTTGSVNQGCIESGTSAHSKNLLSQMEITDVAMAPASDMFEMGVKVQVLKRGTMFAMRGQKLYELYQKYESIEDIPVQEREKSNRLFSNKASTQFGMNVRSFSVSAIPNKSNAPIKNQKTKWRSFSAGIWASPLAGQVLEKKAVKWIIKFGADLPWGLSTSGQKVLTWKTREPLCGRCVTAFAKRGCVLMAYPHT